MGNLNAEIERLKEERQQFWTIAQSEYNQLQAEVDAAIERRDAHFRESQTELIKRTGVIEYLEAEIVKAQKKEVETT